MQDTSTLQYAEVSGIVTKVTFVKGFTTPTEFKIYLPNSKKSYECVCDKSYPLREGDTIYALCIIHTDGKLYLVRAPFVQPAVDRDGIIQCFMRALRKGYGVVIRIYNLIANAAGADDHVISYLTGLAQSWDDTHNPEILFMFKSVEPDDIKKLLAWWHRERNLRRLYLFGLTKTEINACRMTCDEIYQACMTNPYSLPAISLEKCDLILDRLNKKPVAIDRGRGAIIRRIWENQHKRGYVGTPLNFLTREYPDIQNHIEALTRDYGVVVDMNTVYLKHAHTVEKWVADFFVNLRKDDEIVYDTPVDTPVTMPSGKVVERHGATYKTEISDEQKMAVQGALDHKVSIVTGGAGSGKTRCLDQIVHNLELRGIPYAVCSFTGKAVAHIRKVTKKKNPATMHRLIANKRKNQLEKRSTKYELQIPLADYTHVVIDEAATVSMELLYDFLKVHPGIEHVTLIGDVNQLEPIGWGCLMAQLIKSETVPVYYLSTNFRVYTATGEVDGVILNANRMVNPGMMPFEFTPTENFTILEGPIDRVYDIIKSCFSVGIKAEQLVVISPYNRTLPRVNRQFQEFYNLGSRYVVDSRNVKWMIGDIVMLTDNDNEIGVFNGEIGNIRDITDKAILVDFGASGCHEFLLEPTHDYKTNYAQGTTRAYMKNGKQAQEVMDGDEGDNADERTVLTLAHAYAITVDKSQGSEWDYVIFFIDEFNAGSFLSMNRIYTALTRTKRCCWFVVSDVEALTIAATKKPAYRHENLARRLVSALPNLKPYKVVAANSALAMDGDMAYDIDDIPDY